MSEGGQPFYVVGEDEAHRALAMALTDASIAKLAHELGADWLEAESARRWSAWTEDPSVPEARRFGTIKDVASRIRLHGFLDGVSVPPGGVDLRKAIVYASRADPKPALIILLKDTDGDRKIAAAAQQIAAWAANQEGLPPIVIGTPTPEAEAWLLARHDLSPAQDRRRDKAQRVLGFDPTRKPERLTSSTKAAVTDCKRVLRFVLLEEGESLLPGHPRSRPPSGDEPDQLAKDLAAELDRLGDHVGCDLAVFLSALSEGLRAALSEHLPSP